MNQDALKEQAAMAALDYIQTDMVVGVGTGSTVNYFIQALKTKKGQIDGAVASSLATKNLLKEAGITIFEANSVAEIQVYVDGLDEVNAHMQCVKGGGGALTGEKILAAMSKQFIGIADSSKKVAVLGQFPVAVEVIPLARSFVAREMVKLGANPIYRQGFVTDYGNYILDVHNLDLVDPIKMENFINQIPGVVTNGIFAKRPLDMLLLAGEGGVEKL